MHNGINEISFNQFHWISTYSLVVENTISMNIVIQQVDSEKMCNRNNKLFIHKKTKENSKNWVFHCHAILTFQCAILFLLSFFKLINIFHFFKYENCRILCIFSDHNQRCLSLETCMWLNLRENIEIFLRNSFYDLFNFRFKSSSIQSLQSLLFLVFFFLLRHSTAIQLTTASVRAINSHYRLVEKYIHKFNTIQ